MWNIQSALDRGPRKAAFEPSRYFPKAIEVDQFTRLVEPDQVADPAKHRNVGDGIFIVHDPLPSDKMRFHYAKQALRLSDVTLKWPLVLVFSADEFVKEADLAEHRSNPAHLKMHPLDGLVMASCGGRQKLACPLRQILQNGARFEQGQRLAVWAVGIKDRGDLAVGVQRKEFWRVLFTFVEVDPMHFVR